MPTTAFEVACNDLRGWACLFVTLGSVVVVLSEPASLIFWVPGAYRVISAPSGTAGFLIAAFFLLYLVVDTAVGVMCRHQFRRSMGAVFLHHAIVGVATAAFLVPSPPRGYFFYVLGEALTACRLLPLQPRFHARSAVFAFRRALWLYCGARDVYFFPVTASKFGALPACIPPMIAVLLLVLDCMWWRDHVLSGAREAAGSKNAADDDDDQGRYAPTSCGGGRPGDHGADRDSPDSAEDEVVDLLVGQGGAFRGATAMATKPTADQIRRGASKLGVGANGRGAVLGGARAVALGPSTPALRDLDLEAAFEGDPEDCNTP